MRKYIRNWLLTVGVIYVLYVAVSMVFFNNTKHLILGMPPLIFWFMLVPIASPVLLGILYISDKKTNPQWEDEGQ